MSNPAEEQSQEAKKLTGFVKEAEKAFGVVPAAFEELIDLGAEYIYGHVLFRNSTDAVIELQFINGQQAGQFTTMTLQAGQVLLMDGFRNIGVVKYKYSAAGAPTINEFYALFW